MRRLLVVCAALAAGVTTACLNTAPSGPQPETPFAVVYGRIGAPKLTTGITVYILAYKDSAHAVAAESSGFAGSFRQAVDTGNTFVAVIPASQPATYFLDVLATGQNRSGFVSSVDTIRAIRTRFDSLNGSGHDSIAVYDSLP